MSYHCLKACDGRLRGLLRDWELWLRCADRLHGRYIDRIGESPFYFHEVASVGFLASAAAMTGFLPVNEYEIIKKGRDDLRKKEPGRADLWLDAGKRCYSFEFKRAPLAATTANLTDCLEQARRDIRRIDREEYHYGAGGLIARVRDEHRIPVYRAFAESEVVDLAYRIGPEGAHGAFLFFALS